MTRFSGVVGYGSTIEEPSGSGIWVDDIVEYSYFGDVVRDTRKLEPGEHLNSEISVQNSISIVADAYANQHFFNIRYVELYGKKWTVTSVEVRSPRLILSIGEPYNGPVPEVV